MEAAQTELVETNKRPILGEEKRNQYLLALNELVGSLSINESRFIDEGEFCQRYGLKPTFFESLRDLDGLEKDYSKPDDSGLTHYKSTPTLFKLTPEQVYQQGRSIAVRESKADKKQSIVKPVAKKAERPLVRPALPTPLISPMTINEMSVEPVAPFEPYTIQIESASMNLTLDVKTKIHAGIVTAILTQLNH